jgi:hypothetical protein
MEEGTNRDKTEGRNNLGTSLPQEERPQNSLYTPSSSMHKKKKKKRRGSRPPAAAQRRSDAVH